VERELELKARDGTVVPARLAAGPLVDRDEIICVIVTDLTDQRRRTDERDRFLHEQAARTAAESAAAILRDADLRKDEFLAMLAHELRGPLAPIRNGIEILNRIGSQEPVVQQTRDMMARQLEGLVRLVDDLLDVSRVTHGKIQLRLERVDLKDVVAHAVENVRSPIEERGHQLSVELPAEPLPVDADVTRLAQVMNNLLNNAAKFTPRGGRISLAAERPPGSSDVWVRVRDTGVGIAPETLPQMFDLFAQADPSVSRAEGGLGIGLTLSRRLVEMHGGELEGFSPGVGRGSEFVIRLRLAEGGVAARVRGERPGWAQPGPRRRILIVDDNRDAAVSLGELLRLKGHDVRYEFEGARGLAVAAAFEPEIVLLDIGLPGISGHDVAKELRADPRFRSIAVVAVSGYGGEAQRERSLAAGFDEHLVKPVRLDVLEALLAALPGHVHGNV
jgi:signal transduction histidine kinase/ActR/RegA family two-component response regulator